MQKKPTSLSKYNFFSEESDSSVKNTTLQGSISTVEPSLNGSSYHPNCSFQESYIKNSSLPGSGRIHNPTSVLLQNSERKQSRTLNRIQGPAQGWAGVGLDFVRSTPVREPYPGGGRGNEKLQYYRSNSSIYIFKGNRSYTCSMVDLFYTHGDV